MMIAAVTDHVFIDEGHVSTSPTRRSSASDDIGWANAGEVLPTLVTQTANARRHEEESAWRHPDDLTVLLRDSITNLEGTLSWAKQGVSAMSMSTRSPGAPGVSHQVVEALDRCARAGRPRAARPCRRLRGRASDHAVPHTERPRRLERGPPRVHRFERDASVHPALAVA